MITGLYCAYSEKPLKTLQAARGPVESADFTLVLACDSISLFPPQDLVPGTEQRATWSDSNPRWSRLPSASSTYSPRAKPSSPHTMAWPRPIARDMLSLIRARFMPSTWFSFVWIGKQTLQTRPERRFRFFFVLAYKRGGVFFSIASSAMKRQQWLAACSQGGAAAVEQLTHVIEKNAYCAAWMRQGLGMAAAQGRLDVVRLLFERGPMVGARTAILVRAAAGGHDEVVRALLDADANARGDGAKQPLVEAARNGHCHVLETLFARIDKKVLRVGDAIEAAVQAGHVRATDLLQAQVRYSLWPNIMQAAVRGGHMAVAINAQRMCGWEWRHLYEAVCSGCLGTMQAMLGHMPLHIKTFVHDASVEGQIDMLQDLLRRPDAVVPCCTLHDTIDRGQVASVEALLSYFRRTDPTSIVTENEYSVRKSQPFVDIVNQALVHVSTKPRVDPWAKHPPTCRRK
jgi:hypothetical protein